MLWFEIPLVVLLIGLNGALAGSELAFVSLRDGQVRGLEARGRRGAQASALAQEPNRYLSAVQLGITLAGFLASATAAVSLSEPLADALGFLGASASPVAVALVTFALAMLTLIFGELVPKRVAMQRAEGWSLVAARPLSMFITVTRPLIALLGLCTDAVVRALGIDPTRGREEITEEEIAEMVESQPSFSESQRRIMTGAIEIAERPLRHVVVPRTGVVALDASLDVAEARRVLMASGHSRAPVIHGTLDEVVGQVHFRELVNRSGIVGDQTSPVQVLPETLSVLQALRRLQMNRAQLAVVVDEYGGTEGIVTLEDLIEELVGEIYDESDRDLAAVVRDPTGSLILPGSFPVHDLVDVGVVAPAGDYATVAGLVLDQLGHLPQEGESIDLDSCRIDVVATQGRAISSVRITPHPSGTEDGLEPGSTGV